MILKKRESCPCCYSINIKLIFSISYSHQKLVLFLKEYYGENITKYLKDLKNYSYNLLECNACLTIFQENIPTDEFSFILYEEIISKEKSLEKKLSLDTKVYKNYLDEIIALQKLIGKKNYEISVLEFGAGWGMWSKFAQSLNFKCFTNEISLTRVDFIKKNNINNLENLYDYNDNFDIIYADQVFEHINYPKETLKLLYDKLKKNGLIYLKFPDSKNFKKKLKKNYSPKKDCAHPLEHINLYNTKSFQKMIEDLSLVELNIYKYFDWDLKKYPRIIKNLLRFNNVLFKKT